MNILTTFIEFIRNDTELLLSNITITKKQHLNIFHKNELSQKEMIKTTFKHDKILETRNLKKKQILQN